LGGVRTGDTLNELGNKPLDDLLRIDAQVLWYELDIEGPPHRLFELASQPLAIGDPSGGWVVVMRDVTHEREYQTRIQMQERLATVGQLASGIAHDFNNILAAIVVYSDLLKRDPNLTAAGRERLAIIQQQVNRAASLIRQILDFSRRSMIEQSLMDMLPFIKELDKLLRRILPETIRLELSYQPGSYMVNADPTHLQQVFMNLAVNARDASPQGGTLYFKLERVEIKRGDLNPCPIVSPGNWIRITVQDTGEGIPPEILPHVFEPFFTTKPIGQGTGLGLAQAYGIIKQHDGYIDAHSQVGEGSTFHIYLPAQDSPDELMISHESVPEVLGTGETLLVVEDDLSTREAMRELLEAYNYQVLTAANGKEALQVYASNSGQIDLVVSDIVMPEMGGVALYQTLVERWPDVRMLFVTGHPIKDKDQAILRAGNVHWLQKPFSVNSFSQVLQGLLRSEGNDFHD
jgi:signal transduction histidine kinase/ActR/RegA family two-component response regulator